MPSLIRPFILLANLFYLSFIEKAESQWIYPEPGRSHEPTYNYIDTLNASWATDYDFPQLILWCSSDGSKSWDHSKS